LREPQFGTQVSRKNANDRKACIETFIHYVIDCFGFGFSFGFGFVISRFFHLMKRI